MVEDSKENPEIIQRLVAVHRQFLAFLIRRVGSQADAEEILQAAFVRATERSHQLREDEMAIAWFYRLLRNALVDHYQKKGIEEKTLLVNHDRTLQAAEFDRDTERAICECITGLVTTLKPEYSDWIIRVDLKGQSVSEAAQQLGISVHNAADRLHSARLALRERLVQVCAT